METERSIQAFLDVIKELWEEKFSVEIPVHIREKVEWVSLS